MWCPGTTSRHTYTQSRRADKAGRRAHIPAAYSLSVALHFYWSWLSCPFRCKHASHRRTFHFESLALLFVQWEISSQCVVLWIGCFPSVSYIIHSFSSQILATASVCLYVGAVSGLWCMISLWGNRQCHDITRFSSLAEKPCIPQHLEKHSASVQEDFLFSCILQLNEFFIFQASVPESFFRSLGHFRQFPPSLSVYTV